MKPSRSPSEPSIERAAVDPTGAPFLRLSILAVVVLAAYTLLVIVPAARHVNTNGFAAYYTASRILLDEPRDVVRVYDDQWFQSRMSEYGFGETKDIYNVQPPTMTLLMAPVAWLPRPAARVTWIAIGVACWVAGCGILLRVISRKPVTPGSLVPFIASTALFPPVRENFRQGQCYALLFLLLAIHLRLVLEKRPQAQWAAGVPLGLMLVLKVAGAWLWPLLVFGRRWRTIGAAASTFIAVSIASSAMFGFRAWTPYFRDVPRFARDGVLYQSGFQTVTSFFGHLFIHDAMWNPHPVFDVPLLARCATAMTISWVGYRSVRCHALQADCVEARILSMAIFAAPIVSFAPKAESYHYLLVLPSLAIAWCRALETRADRRAWIVLGIATALLVIPQKLYMALPIQSGWLALLAYPRVYGAVVLWGWLMSALKRHRAAHSCAAEAVDRPGSRRSSAVPFQV